MNHKVVRQFRSVNVDRQEVMAGRPDVFFIFVFKAFVMFP